MIGLALTRVLHWNLSCRCELLNELMSVRASYTETHTITLYTEYQCELVITGRNEVVAKVMFLHVCVILFTGGGSPGRESPPGQGEYPLDQGEPPRTRENQPRPGRTPRTRQTPPRPGRHPPPDQADTPQTRQTPPGEQTPEYGLRAAGTHPTGMHSCLFIWILRG